MTNLINMSVWGREFEMAVEFDSSDNSITAQALKSAMDEFCHHREWLDYSKFAVEQYCKEKVTEDKENQKKESIFSYVVPEYFYVKMSEGQPKIAMVCRYRYDIEHGLMVVFDKNGIPVVGGQDMPF